MGAKKEYWTVWTYGVLQVCSKHKTAAAAIKAAKQCEAAGGAKHRIIEVREVLRGK